MPNFFFISSEFMVNIPPKAYKNGTMFLHIVLVNYFGKPYEWTHLKRDGLTVLQRTPLTEYMIPKPATFNLLNEIEVSAHTTQHFENII